MDANIRLLKALGDETRMRIVRMLLNGERCACELVPSTGKAQPTVSRHLKILEEAGVVKSRREGTSIYYVIKSENAVRIAKVLGLSKLPVVKAKC